MDHEFPYTAAAVPAAEHAGHVADTGESDRDRAEWYVLYLVDERTGTPVRTLTSRSARRYGPRSTYM